MDIDNIKNLEEKIKSLPEGKERALWQKVLEEAKRFETMPQKEVEAELKKSDEEVALAEEQLKILAMSKEEREKELTGVKAEAARKTKEAEKEWEEAMAAITPVLVEEDVKRREDEARMEKTITADKTGELLENLKLFLEKKDLAGVGAILKILAVQGEMRMVLNLYGYPSNVLGMQKFFNEILIGDRPVQGEKAYENLLFQQKVYSLEQDISSLAANQNSWTLAFSVGRKGRIWHELEEKDHLAAVLWAVEKIKPETAARQFGPAAYGYFTPREKGNLAAGADFELSMEGKLILALYGNFFEQQLTKNYFNPAAAEVLSKFEKELGNIGLPESFSEALKKYLDEIKNKPEMTDVVWEELTK
ncbi:hypothetical protein KKD80_02225 [Patescibacteria group bacterium]|nr:hypothetical protein [Patescibacteria group bacterium]